MEYVCTIWISIRVMQGSDHSWPLSGCTAAHVTATAGNDSNSHSFLPRYELKQSENGFSRWRTSLVMPLAAEMISIKVETLLWLHVCLLPSHKTPIDAFSAGAALFDQQSFGPEDAEEEDEGLLMSGSGPPSCSVGLVYPRLMNE
jgi:hypothetical protein